MFTHGLKKHIGNRAEYDKFGSGFIWGIDENGNQIVIAQLTIKPDGTESESEKIKKDVGEFVADAINEKLNK